jgi:hypothetical protein
VQRHSLERLLLAADVAAETWRRNRDEKHNPGGYLHSLCASLAVPEWYVPFAERTAQAEAARQRKALVEAEQAALKAQEEAQTMARNALWETLSEEQREEYCSATLSGMSADMAEIVPPMTVTAMAKLMAWEEIQGCHPV